MQKENNSTKHKKISTSKEKKLELKIIAQTDIQQDLVFNKDHVFEIAGVAASLCYDENTNNNLAKYLNESHDEKIKRCETMLKIGHGSPLEHYSISFILENVSKIQSIILNNQRIYSLTERSFRYTKPENISPLYKKWLDIFLSQGLDRKKSQENARYMISMFDKNSTAYYTMNIRQINILLRMFEEILNYYKPATKKIDVKSSKKDVFLNSIVNEISKLYTVLKPLDIGIQKSIYQSLNLFTESETKNIISGDFYTTTSEASAVAIAQLQRHRSILYKINIKDIEHLDYYIPECLSGKLRDEWIEDAQSVFYPNCTLFRLLEQGTISDFMMKYKIRSTRGVQEETRLNVESVREDLKKLIKSDTSTEYNTYTLLTDPDQYDTTLNIKEFK